MERKGSPNEGEPKIAAIDPKLTAWLIVIFGYLLPLAHVLISPRGGRWTPPPGSRCPLGPRVGWIVLVLLLGPLGWLLFWRSRGRSTSR